MARKKDVPARVPVLRVLMQHRGKWLRLSDIQYYMEQAGEHYTHGSINYALKWLVSDGVVERREETRSPRGTQLRFFYRYVGERTESA